MSLPTQGELLKTPLGLERLNPAPHKREPELHDFGDWNEIDQLNDSDEYEDNNQVVAFKHIETVSPTEQPANVGDVFESQLDDDQGQGQQETKLSSTKCRSTLR